MSRRRGVDLGPRVDLHCHSSASDGLHPPERVAEMAAAAGLSALAITDHDVPPVLGHGVKVVDGHSMRLIAGVELSTMHEGRELHLLAYFPEEMPEMYAEWCRNRARWRASWYDACLDALKLDIPRADDAARKGLRTLTRVHLARSLVNAGVSPNLRSAFQQHVGHTSTVIPPLNLSFLDALSVAVDAGAWTAWAHPPPKQAEAWAQSFAAAGLHALETHRPVKTGRNRLSAIALQNGMGITGGSDWHGWGKRKMGSFRVPARALHKTDKALDLLG
jgi:predicted metal-dependent phosphoesterase TrpH